MQHLSSKILAAIVACSATMLLSGINVHASANNQPGTPNRQARLVKKAPASSNGRTGSLPVKLAKNQLSHHYTYRNLNAVKNNQLTAARLGSHRGRHAKVSKKRPKKVTRRTANKKRNRNARRVSRKRRPRRSKNVRRNHRKPAKSAKQAAFPPLTHPHEKVINQKKSAVNHYSQNLGYVENPQPDNFQSSGQYGDSDYARTGTPITSNDGSITFHRLTFIPKKLGNNQFYSPQGLVVDGHYAYVITNATNSYETSHNNDSDSNRQTPASYVDGDDSTGTSPYKVGASQIIRIDLRRHVKDYNDNLKAAHRNIKVGPVFYGGHGQGLAYNPKSGQLWLLDNKAGQVNKTAASLINLKTLAPDLRINFRFGNTTIGDDLAFDRKGNALNATEAGDGSFATSGSVKLFSGSITPKGVHMRLIKQALRWAPSDVIQGLTYNPRNNRFYILGDDAVTSIPANKLGKLQPSDVWYTPFNTTREFEGLSFDRSGNAYLLVSRSPEILKADYDQHF